MTTTELKPCPFCSGRAELYRDANYFIYVECTCCCATQGTYDNKKDAIESWNKRFDPDGVPINRHQCKWGYSACEEVRYHGFGLCDLCGGFDVTEEDNGHGWQYRVTKR